MLNEFTQGHTFLCVKAGLTGISGAATTFSTGATTLQYAVLGKAATKATVTAGASPTTDAVTGNAITLVPNKGMVVVWCLDLPGNVKVVAGPAADLDSAGNFKVYPQFPGVPDTLCPFAYHVIKAGSTTVGTWTFGSSNWNATGLSHTVVDVLVQPARPQIS